MLRRAGQCLTEALRGGGKPGLGKGLAMSLSSHLGLSREVQAGSGAEMLFGEGAWSQAGCSRPVLSVSL